MYKINKLKKMGWDSLSFKTKIIRADMVFVKDDIYPHTCEMDYESKYFTRFCIDIYVTNEDSYAEKKIGFLSGYFFTSMDIIHDDCTFGEVADSIGGDLFDMAEEIIGKDLNVRPEIADEMDTIAYIDEFYIGKKYRNYGIGSYLIENLREILYFYSKECVTHCIVLPQPRVMNHNRKFQNISDNNKDKYILEKKLHNFYIKNGFKYIENSKYMLRVD